MIKLHQLFIDKYWIQAQLKSFLKFKLLLENFLLKKVKDRSAILYVPAGQDRQGVLIEITVYLNVVLTVVYFHIDTHKL